MRVIALALILFALPASAQWKLDNPHSSLNFISTKNTHISESHVFDRLEGTINDKGDLAISIDLTSVNTSIDIRNTRMQEMLFNVAKYAEAVFTAKIPMQLLSLENGATQRINLSGTLALHGESAPVTASIQVVKLNSNTLLAYTTQPIILNAQQFELGAGVEALQTIAGLSNISLAVPVSFSVQFSQ